MLRATLTLAVSTLALTACSGGGGDRNGGPDIIYSNAPTDTVQKALVDGKTVGARKALVSSHLINRETGETIAISPDVFASRLPTDGEFAMIVNGEEIVFTVDDRDLNEDMVTYYGWSKDDPDGDGYYSAYVWANGFAPNSISASGDSYVNVWEYVFADDDTQDHRGYAVTGVETTVAARSALDTATYQGYGEIRATPTQGYVDHSTSQMHLQSNNVQMSANFGAGTISGSMGDLNWGSASDERAAIPGQITMNQASITADGGYSGTLTPNGAFQANGLVTAGLDGTYNGAFFGPEADQTAGAISLSLSDSENDYVGSGFFNTFKD